MLRSILAMPFAAVLVTLVVAAPDLAARLLPASILRHPASVLLPTVARTLMLLVGFAAAAAFVPRRV